LTCKSKTKPPTPNLFRERKKKYFFLKGAYKERDGERERGDRWEWNGVTDGGWTEKAKQMKGMECRERERDRMERESNASNRRSPFEREEVTEERRRDNYPQSRSLTDL